ncbi:MAG: HTTM domain-containing protein [Candidatus Obscuribacterales bacterium]|jgi:preprotein translocase subunit Sec61beta|nr:HTTM domain-containing protein [Candidatus Obscuribacterales bacterium]
MTFWNDFFFKLSSPNPMAVVRIGLAFIFFVWLIVAFQSADTWYGGNVDAIVSLEQARLMLPPFTISLLTVFKPDSLFLQVFMSLGLLASLTLLVGWHSRISAILCFVILESLMHRNPFILSSSDELMSQMFFYVLISNSGLGLSFDSRNRNLDSSNKVSPWAQRLLQIQICIVYLQTFWFKVVQPDWQSGNVIYYVLRTKEIANFPLPDFIANSPEICRYLTWTALLMELIIPVLIWWSPIRRIVMFLAILFHLSMEYCLTIPFFQPLMIVGLLSFAEDEDYRKIASFFKPRSISPKPVKD